MAKNWSTVNGQKSAPNFKTNQQFIKAFVYWVVPQKLQNNFRFPIQVQLMPLFHQRIKPRSCRRPLIVGSLGKNGKKIDQWGGRQNRYEGLGLTTDRPQDAPGGPRQSLTGLGLRTD